MDSIINLVVNIISSNNILGLRTLLEDGLDPNITGFYNNETALMYATTYGHIDIIRLLLEYNADPNLTDDEGETALAMATSLNVLHSEDIIKTLLEYNADPNAQGYGGYTPLMKASIESYINIVQLLLDNGADPFIKNDEGDTALDMAESPFHNANDAVIDLLKNRMATIRLQSRHRGRKTRNKLRTSMARRRSALSQVADEYGLEEDIIDMLNSRITRPSHLDMIDETPRNLLSQGEIGTKNSLLKKENSKRKKKRTQKKKKKQKKEKKKKKLIR